MRKASPIYEVENEAFKSILETRAEAQYPVLREAIPGLREPEIAPKTVRKSVKKYRSRINVTLNDDIRQRAKLVAGVQNLKFATFCAHAIAKAVRDFESQIK